MKLILIKAVSLFIEIYTWLILGRVIISWIRPSTYSPTYDRFAGFLYDITEPVLAPIRNRLPTSGFGFDFSPILVLLLLRVARQIVIQLLWRLPLP